jgi:hypothetical protein
MSDSNWAFNLRSYQRDDSDSDGVDDATSITTDAQLLKDLDLSSRHEEVIYKPNPWNIAKINAASRRKISARSPNTLTLENALVKPRGQILIDAFEKQSKRSPLQHGANILKPSFRSRQINGQNKLTAAATTPTRALETPDTTLTFLEGPPPSTFLLDCSDFSSGQPAGFAEPDNRPSSARIQFATRNSSHTEANHFTQTNVICNQSPLEACYFTTSLTNDANSSTIQARASNHISSSLNVTQKTPSAHTTSGVYATAHRPVAFPGTPGSTNNFTHQPFGTTLSSPLLARPALLPSDYRLSVSPLTGVFSVISVFSIKATFPQLPDVTN